MAQAGIKGPQEAALKTPVQEFSPELPREDAHAVSGGPRGPPRVPWPTGLSKWRVHLSQLWGVWLSELSSEHSNPSPVPKNTLRLLIHTAAVRTLPVAVW